MKNKDDSKISNRISVWGIGIRFTALSLGYSFAIMFIHYSTHPLFDISFLQYRVLLISGLILVILGMPLFIVSAFSVHKAYAEDVLRTKGVYSICRHPLYVSFILFIVPGICLLFKSWLALSVPFVIYKFFRILIKDEENYLSERFETEYERYRREVSLVFPKIWRYKK